MCLAQRTEQCQGVARIHEFGLIHLDIKSQNFLVAPTTGGVEGFLNGAVTVKLADLENSVIKEELSSGGHDDTDVIPDTLDWTAPELMLPEGHLSIDKACDIYALAVTW
jgi:serine/threonine protein kinase